jgi:hypothetical protein
MPILLIATALLSASVAPAANSPANPAKNDPNRIVCKQVSRTGSRASVEKICATLAEWRAVEQRGRDFIAYMQGGGSIGQTWVGQ